MNRIITKAIRAWQSWRSKQRLYRAIPELRRFDEEERDTIRKHGRVDDIRKARKDYMTDVLRRAVQ